MTDISYFNISEMKLSITSLYIISDALKYGIIWTENSYVMDSFISEILKYESLVIQSLTEKILGCTIHTFIYKYYKLNVDLYNQMNNSRMYVDSCVKVSRMCCL